MALPEEKYSDSNFIREMDEMKDFEGNIRRVKSVEIINENGIGKLNNEVTIGNKL